MCSVMTHLPSAAPIQRCVGTDIMQTSYVFTTPAKFAPFDDKHLKSNGAKVLSASALISDNTVVVFLCCLQRNQFCTQ